jgi:predicted ribosomally synthesized peptide with SipW-like signal peptide
MKKKILTLALVVALIAIMVGGTLAYFTADDEVTNTFTIGSVKIEIWENGKETNDDTISFTKPLTPIVKTNPSEDESYQAKVIKVKNTGVNDAYIRTHIAIPTALVNYLVLDVDATGWTKLADSTAKVGEVDYTVYTYDYNTAVVSDAFTTELLKGVYLAADVDLQEDANGNLLFVKKANGAVSENSGFVAHTKTATGYTSTVINVLVASQAIQAQGFDAGATAALNTGFATHPWATP